MKDINNTILIIGTVAFAIDIAERTLKQWDDQSNCIAFDNMKDEGDYFTMLYDINTGNISSDFHETNKVPAHIISVTIPAVLLQQAALNQEECKALNELAAENKWNLFSGNELLARRLAGELPHIDLAGNDFTIDWRLRELRETAAPHNYISLKNMGMSEDGTRYCCLFHTKNRTEYFPSADIMEMPAHVVLLEIPYELLLDPVAVAREHQLPDTQLLIDFPIQEHLAAKVLPLSETNLSEIIKKSRKDKR